MRMTGSGLKGFLAGVGLSALVLAGGVVAARPADEPHSLGFVDVREVLGGSTALRDAEARIRNDRESGLSALAERSRKLEGKRSELELLTLGTGAWRALNREIRLEAYAIQSDREDLARESDDRAKRAYGDAYRSLNDAAREVASRRGFSAVLATSPPEPPGSDPKDVFERILLRQVIWADGNRDVTQDVLTALNTK